jgi:hypothetical protein
MRSPALSTSQLRTFGLTLGSVFALFFGLIPLAIHHHAHVWPWITAVLLWIVALAMPSALRHVHAGWFKLGLWLGWLNTRVILTLLFGFMIAPLGLAMRLFGRDRVGRQFQPQAQSYRTSSRNRPAHSMEHPY